MSTLEELSRCPRCRAYESYLYASFDEVVAHTHCRCQDRNRDKNKDKERKKLDLAFDKLEQFMKHKERKIRA